MNPHKVGGKCGIEKSERELSLVLYALFLSLYADYT